MSLNPDSVIKTKLMVAKIEEEMKYKSCLHKVGFEIDSSNKSLNKKKTK
jgi:hypothetical protein